ncbi:hypothetical protein D3C87_906250 [compost metagenome]
MKYVDYALRNNEDKEIIMNLSKAKTLSLLVVSKLPLDAGEAGPSLVVLAEKVEANQGVNWWENMVLLKGSVDYGNAVVTTQEVYSTKIDEYAFNFIVTYTNDESKAETDKILKSASFK